MFERFTERARQVVVFAQDEARILKHNYIGTEHILLGLLREEQGLAARVLESLDIRVERVRAQVVRIVDPGEEVTGLTPFTPSAKKVIELALRESLSLGHNHIGTEHILLGLLRVEEGTAMRVLLDLEADSEKIRNEVIRMLGGRQAPGEQAPQLGPSVPWLEDIVLFHGLLDGSALYLRELAGDIEERLGRSADAGDLLVVLASVPDGVAARTFAALGIDGERLVRAVAEARLVDERSKPPPDALYGEVDRLRLEKEAALEANEFKRAADLGARERELREGLAALRPGKFYAEVRARLGLKES